MASPSSSGATTPTETACNMQTSRKRPRPQSNYIPMEPSMQHRGPPRAYHEYETPKPSQGRLIEMLMSRPKPEIRLYFVHAQDVAGPLQGVMPNSNEMAFLPPALNRFTTKGDETHDWSSNRGAQQHIALPSALLEGRDAELQLKIGTGGMPSQYETHEPYIWVRRSDDFTAQVRAPAGYPVCIRIKFDIRQVANREIKPPPQVPATRSCAALLLPPPRDDEVLDAVRIEISMDGVPNKLCLHMRFVDSMGAGNSLLPDLVRPHLFNVGRVKLEDPLEQDTVSEEGVIVESTYTVKLNPPRKATLRQCLKGGPSSWVYGALS